MADADHGDVAWSGGVASVQDLTITSEATGDLLYYSGSAWVRLATSTTNSILNISAGIPAWTSTPTLATTTISSLTVTGDLTLTGTSTISTGANADLTLDAGSGTVFIGDGTAKLDAGTIDPTYFIDGISYATYVASMPGIKEEITGVIKLNPTSEIGLFMYIMDFDELEVGSDVWLFRNIVDWGENMDNLVIILSAENSNARVSYKKEPANNRIIIYGSNPSEISYRLTAPRFDHQQWSNIAMNQGGGFIIPDLTINFNDSVIDDAIDYGEFNALLNESGHLLNIDGAALTVEENQTTGQIVQLNISQLKSGLASLGLIVNEQGVLTLNKLKAQEVEVSRGISIQDRATGEYHCMYMENGKVQTEVGKCELITSGTESENNKIPVAGSGGGALAPSSVSAQTEDSTILDESIGQPEQEIIEENQAIMPDEATGEAQLSDTNDSSDTDDLSDTSLSDIPISLIEDETTIIGETTEPSRQAGEPEGVEQSVEQPVEQANAPLMEQSGMEQSGLEETPSPDTPTSEVQPSETIESSPPVEVGETIEAGE
jgi:hypothetical protein